MKPTAEQKEYIAADGRTVLVACPGSGKTQAIAFKVGRLLKEWRNEHAGILILSFTNVAVDEIRNRIEMTTGVQLSDPHKILTIDTFTNRYVTLPFGHLIVTTDAPIKIAESNAHLDSWKSRIRLSMINIPVSDYVKPSSIRYTPDGKLTFNVSPAYRRYRLGIADQKKVADYVVWMKSRQVKAGLLSTADSAYFALKVLEQHPDIATALATRFPYLVIDEAQDTSAIQDALVSALIKGGLVNVDLVGDPYQAVFRWRGAMPELMQQKVDSTDWKTLSLTSNRRSTQKIIDCYSTIRGSRDGSIKSVVSTERVNAVQVLSYPEGTERLAVSKFIALHQQRSSDDMVVAVRRNEDVEKIKGKSRNIRPWKEESPSAYDLISAVELHRAEQYKSAIQSCRLIKMRLSGRQQPDEIYDRLSTDTATIEENASYFELLDGINSMMQLAVPIWTQKVEALCASAFQHPSFSLNLKERFSIRYKKEHAELAVGDVFAPVNDLGADVVTIHQCKGRNIGSLLLFLDDGALNEWISAKLMREQQSYFPTEEQGLLYVAMSRPKHMLGIALPESILKSRSEVVRELLPDASVIPVA